MNLIKRINLAGIAGGLVLASALAFGAASAQTETVATSADIPPELIPLAQDLGCQTSAECAEKFDANIEQGITLAQKYDIYTPEQEKVAATFKTEVLERLRTVSQDNFEEEILALADRILKEKPALARTMGVTRQAVSAAETIINTVKDAGVDIRTCRKSPENLSREQLIACVKAGNDLSDKGKSVEDYIPKQNIKAKEVEQMLSLENSLLAGEYPGLGRIGAKEAGQVCLKPGSESIADCDQIAERFFGAEGLKHLRETRQQTTRVKEYYTKGIEKMELVTPDGQKLIGKGAIRNACDRAFEEENLGLARACGNFAVKNGFATQEEIESGLKLLESFSQKARAQVDFDDCRFNPESCREFLPDDFRQQFDSQFEIFRIMSESIGFDPSRCDNAYDPDIGKRCLEGAKKALSRVEEIAKNSPEAREIVDEIRFHIAEGERMTERRDEFHQDSRSGGMAGPGGCREPEECFKYCSQAANSAECVSFGAKSQIFDQNTAVQKFNMVNERFDTSYYPEFTGPADEFGSRPPFQNQIDPGFNRYPYPYPPQQPVGPSPECFAAIGSGDFVKAKTVCSSTTENYPRPIAEPYPVCPIYSMPSPCPEGQMRQQASDARGCLAYGACTVIENYRPIDTSPRPCSSGQYWNGATCVATSTTDCPAGQYWDPARQSCQASAVASCPEANQYRDPEKNICITQTPCPSGQYWDYMTDACAAQTIPRECPTGNWWDSATQSCRSSIVPTVGSCDYSTQYWKPSTSECQYRSNCYDTNNSEYNSQECQGVRGSTTVSYGCGSLTTQATCQASPGCGWANGACGGSMTTGNTCPTGQYWYTPPSGGAGYCSSTTTCSSGQWWNGTACVATSVTDCPSGQYWYTPPSGGTGYCMTTSGTNCASDQYWNGSACVSSSTSGSSSCTSGQYWNGTSCVTNSTTTDTASMSTACAQAGGTWDASSNYCKMPTTTTSGSASCASDQYWNGSACVSNSPTPTPEPTPTPTQSDPATMCAQSGGTWTGSTCQMAQNISNQKAYYSYYKKQSGSLLAQVFGAFADLFR